MPVVPVDPNYEYFVIKSQDPNVPDSLAVDPTGLRSGKYIDTLVIRNIFFLLVSLIKSIQGVAANQSRLLKTKTDWQQAYTEQMNGMHVFVQGNGDAFGISTKDGSGDRQDLGSTVSNLLEIQRANKATIADDAKSLQSNLNQSTDASNQQCNMCDQILQQLTTILAAIYR